MNNSRFRYPAVALAIASVLAVVLLRQTGTPGIEYNVGPFKIAATFRPDPPKSGKNTLTLVLRNAAGKPISGAEVSGAAVMPAMGQMAEMRSVATAEELGVGRYRLEFDLSMAGPWPLTVGVKARDGETAELRFDFKTGIPVKLAASTGDEKRATEAATEIDYYTCSMHPSVHSEAPGTCPICSMDLIPVTREEVQSGTIVVDSLRRQLIGVKTAPVGRSEVTILIRAVGRITYDETRLTDITLKYKGWIGKVFADYTGVEVAAGEPLFSVYAPELVSAQEEFLESRRRSHAGESGNLLATARRRLRLWNITEGQIDQLAKNGKASDFIPILSPASGTAIKKNIVDGSAVGAGELLYRLADLTALWVEADIYEEDLPLAKVGQSVEITLSYLPGKAFAGTISYIYPYLDPISRTARVRLEVPNPTGELKPDMYANVELEVPYGEHLVVPEEAVIMAGKTNLVFVDLGEGKLKPRKITIGRKGPDGFIVLDGLQEGETVVTSGNFLIAAESKLKAGTDQW